MKILLFGSQGQLGQALTQALNDVHDLHLSFRADCNLTFTSQIETLIDRVKPDLIINAAAYTNVDLAENNYDEAFLINTKAPEMMARKASILNIPLIHFSTDYVFDGLKEDAYNETDRTSPQSYYAKTKLMGEEVIRSNLTRHLIIRTSWLYGNNNQNFVYKIIHPLIQEKNFGVVNDAWGSPTSASFIARSILKMIPDLRDELYGTYHLANLGYCTRFEFASFIERELIQLGEIKMAEKGHIHPIFSKDYASNAKRPLHALLDTTKIKNSFMLEFVSWQDELKHFLNDALTRKYINDAKT